MYAYPHVLSPILRRLRLRFHTLEPLPLQLRHTLGDVQNLMLQHGDDTGCVQSRPRSIDEEHVREPIDGHRHVSLCIRFPAVVEFDVIFPDNLKGVMVGHIEASSQDDDIKFVVSAVFKLDAGASNTFDWSGLVGGLEYV